MIPCLSENFFPLPVTNLFDRQSKNDYGYMDSVDIDIHQ